MNFVNHSYHPIVFLVLESGAVYSATLLALLILYKTGSWFQYVLLDAVRRIAQCSSGDNLHDTSIVQISPIVGLVFSMIIVRIGLGITTLNGSSGYNASTAAKSDERKSTFQRVQLQFATPSQVSDYAGPDRDVEMSMGLRSDAAESARTFDGTDDKLHTVSVQCYAVSPMRRIDHPVTERHSMIRFHERLHAG